MTDAERRRRVDHVCDAALDRDPRDRAAFVAAECGLDEALRQEVEALLAHAQIAEGFLAAPIGAVAASVLGDEPEASLVGKHIGAYQIVSHLGTGGMGEVYRARDLKLNRDIALKVLPEVFALDRDRRARFKREAHLLASLNHPNIAAIYGLEESNPSPGSGQAEVQALVLELVEGPTLADRIAQGPIPVDEALRIAQQIADALETAHEHGIIHRDLKPANIKLRPDGAVKVLDFGLAKAIDVGSAPNVSQSPAITSPAMMTGVGTILGTAAYMAPEQTKGRAADKRCDVWAFGCVLYEMLTGTRAFAEDDVTETIAAIIRGEPDWRTLPVDTPPAIRRLLRRALEKDARQRLRDMGSARLEIQDALTAPAETAAPAVGAPEPPPTRTSPRYRWVAAAIVLVATVAMAAVMYRQRPAVDMRSYRSSILPPDKVAFTAVTPATRFVVSPDGRRLAFLAAVEGVTRLWVRSLDALTAQPLGGTEGAVVAFWSHDSRSIAFGAGGKLKRIDASGGPALTLADMAGNNGGSWNQDGVIVFPPTGVSPLHRIAATGGVPSPVTTLDEAGGDSSHWQPFFLPDGRHFLYHMIASKTAPDGAIAVGSLDAAEKSRLLLQGGSNAQYSQGYLLFMRDTTLMAQRFDADRLQLIGEAAPLAEQMRVGGSTGRTGAFSVSETGVLVYQAGVSGSASRLAWYDRTGKEIGAVGEAADYGDLELSGDDKRAAVSLVDPGKRTRDIWLFDLARGLRTRFTFDPADELTAKWSPDNGRLLFNSRMKGQLDLHHKPSSGGGHEDVLFADTQSKSPSSWSPDGRLILYTAQALAGSRSDIWILPLSGDKKPFPFLNTSFNEGFAQFSPDGQWIAYQSDESGRLEIYVAPFSGKGGKWQVSTTGGFFPRWRRDGRELFYIAPGGRLLAASVSAQSSGFEVGAVATLFTIRMKANLRYPYDVTADGRRFLVNTLRDEASPEPLTLLLNWPAALRQ